MYCPSSGELCDFDVEGTYCPSSGELYCPSFGELYDFDMRRHVLSIIWGAL